MESSKPGIVSN